MKNNECLLHAVKFYVSVIANAVKQSGENEQILDCFTLRVRNDGHRVKYIINIEPTIDKK